MNRRKFIKNSLLTLGGISLVSGFYSWQVEPFWLDITKQKILLKNLPTNLNGKTLMQISDIHIGNRFDYKFIIESFNRAKRYNPDFVVYTGDYVSTYKDQVQYGKLSEVLKHTVQGSIATIGILGNHDYGRNWKQPEVAEKITSMMQTAGVTMLRNEQYVVRGLNFVGFDDYWGMNFNPQAALIQYDASIASIALCHNPDVCDIDIWQDFNGLILAGHTHGGQVKPPFLPPPMLPVKNKKYTSGLIELDKNRILYINRALGHLWQVRLNVRPEISIFELQAA